MLWAKIRYEDAERLASMGDAEWSEFCDVWPMRNRDASKLELPERRRYCVGYEEMRFAYDEAVYLEMKFGIKLEVVQWADSGLMLSKQASGKYGNFQGSHGTPTASDLMAGRAVQIAIPDLGLLQIDEVDYMEDACTDEVGRHLADGWRILAICPPNAQRRPDYIFGRRKRDA